MSDSANVRSVEAIQRFRVVLANFAEDARTALGSSEMEVRRTRDWLARDQYSYWQGQVKRRNEALAIARTELFRRRLSQSNSDAISDTEQKENLKHAQMRVREAEDMVERIKKWVPVLEHAIAEYHATSQPLGDRLTGSLVNSLSLLDRMVATLDSYLTLAPPSTPTLPESTATNSDGPATARSSAANPAPADADAPAVAAEGGETKEEEEGAVPAGGAAPAPGD